MKLEKIQIRNFKIWKNNDLEDFRKYNLIIGENNTGKSTILHAILSCVHDIDDNIISYDQKESYVTCFFSQNNDDLISIYRDWIEKAYSTNPSEMLEKLKNKEQFFGRNLRCYSRHMINDNFAISRQKSDWTYLEYQKFDKAFLDFGPKLQNLSYLNQSINKFLNYSIILIPSKRVIETEDIKAPINEGYIFNGSDLKRNLHNLKNSQKKSDIQQYKNWEELIENLSFSPGKPFITSQSGQVVDIYFEKKGNLIKIEELGDGIRDVVIILGYICANPKKIILLEEPELHLHPRAIRELRHILKYEIDNQIFIATHNPAMIGSIDENTKVIKLNIENGEHLVKTLNEKSDFQKFREEYGLLKSDSLFADILVYVEGESDKKAFEKWFELLHPGSSQINFIPTDGITKIPKYIKASLLLELTQDYYIFIIIDRDKLGKTVEEIKKDFFEEIEKELSEKMKGMNNTDFMNSIYVLNQQTLESYYLKSSVISKWLNITIEDVETELNSIKINNPVKKLKLLAKKHGKKFKKNKNIEEFLSLFLKEDIDEEIKRLIDNFLNKIKT